MNRPARQTTRDLRRHNRSLLLSRIYLHGPTSRQELIQATGLSSGTVSNVVGELIEDGLVAEAGLVGSDGGRPRTVLRARDDFGTVAGVDFGETHVRIGLFDAGLETIATTSYAIADVRIDPESVARLVTEGVDEVFAQSGRRRETLLGIGVGVPGAVLGEGRQVHAPTLGWSAVPMADMLRAAIAEPVHIDNCARTLGQAEMWRGAGRGADRAIVALIGVGVGAALTTGADAYREGTSMTSEWGHTVILAGGKSCRCGSRGCLEAYVGADAILEEYDSRSKDAPLTATDKEQRFAELVARASTDRPGPGHSAAAQVLGQAAEYLGIGIANLINMLQPDRVVLSGWAGAAMGEAILPAVRDAARRHSLAYMYGGTRIVMGELGPEAVALGAASLPIVEILMNGGLVPTVVEVG